MKEELIQESNESEAGKKAYQEYVKEVTPTHCFGLQLVKAFFVGGTICVLGQWLMKQCMKMGVEEELSGAWCSLILVTVSVLLTGSHLYSRLVRFAGAGALVPITGFANSVASSAIEFKKEGQIFGIGCKIFTIAGPVILYGIVSSWCLGFFYWLKILLFN